jgi:hypothetical protein
MKLPIATMINFSCHRGPSGLFTQLKYQEGFHLTVNNFSYLSAGEKIGVRKTKNLLLGSPFCPPALLYVKTGKAKTSLNKSSISFDNKLRLNKRKISGEIVTLKVKIRLYSL